MQLGRWFAHAVVNVSATLHKRQYTREGGEGMSRVFQIVAIKVGTSRLSSCFERQNP